MKRAIYPGSFDPPTNGHLSVLMRALPVFDEIVVAIMENPDKQPMFTAEDRKWLLEQSVPAEVKGKIRVRSYCGLVADLAGEEQAVAIIRGLRDSLDTDAERRMAHMNEALSGIPTLFLYATPETGHVASSLIKDIVKHGGRVDAFVPAAVAARLHRSQS
ncbi:pantetheine-phosphate adenylyltransferase [Alicyclobacillus tolerans]|uniref:Phosphopantetheine adenylyltransferase n=2 Tax=Alicyclobacillus tolerans TaxID=90970 RepID=A0ABT9LW23_9BACL|nr:MULTISPECIES: pantetheine-phosphate adenylyltransferase [Alicyclobacillus]MDP9728449.1 pantetheine-phosphate adenylyltransferase [Alicyclobacillus tengchongensis]SHK16976.1 Phosphopantetheine adenylyltransferase [Alicyclobacillus montanus]